MTEDENDYFTEQDELEDRYSYHEYQLDQCSIPLSDNCINNGRNFCIYYSSWDGSDIYTSPSFFREYYLICTIFHRLYLFKDYFELEYETYSEDGYSWTFDKIKVYRPISILHFIKPPESNINFELNGIDKDFWNTGKTLKIEYDIDDIIQKIEKLKTAKDVKAFI